ncbi:c-type cytochrome biogenesis protein CcmI [Gallaecimonas xiamenensis]|uniref:Cytochrome c-type biogenesis protein CcmI n=1 Tax=Gallaecimonas xiamenensis 3-C-1 TaxID=745411 RepID=K2JLT2_9GAMM|nr:c-type cytochrome biogenesis protein CcmI [Gallaecimonas xiamenensis]EKE75382.1 cytochrome c-type biogenesis protein CcmI [Gallaecimonas xiamenensis 3-C-1]
MTLLYLGLGALLVLAVLLVLLPPLSQGSLAQRQLNLKLYKDRRQELALEHRQGLIDDDRLAELETELKRSLLDDAEQGERAQQSVNWKVLLPGVIVLVLGALGLYWKLGSSDQLAHWQEVMGRLPTLADRVLRPDSQAPLSRDEMQDLALAVRTRLAQQDDKNGWILLGRVGFALGDGRLAAEAFQKALGLDPDNGSALLGLAQVLLVRQEEGDLDQAQRALARLLAQEPQDIDALLLAGLVAYQQQDFTKAADRWQQIAGQLAPEDPRLPVLQGRIHDAQQQLKRDGRRLVVKVDVSEALRQSLPKDATLFVFAKAPAGGPPLAAVRLPLSRLPTEVELSDATSMIPGRSLSDADSYIVGAQIAQSGTVGQTELGDLSGETGPVAASAQQVLLTIDKRIK